jgi:GT2 family glycosyltransferase
MEVIVVDNNSSDGSPEMVEAEFPHVKLIRAGANLGFSKANNVGIRQSGGRYVSLINSDAKVIGNCLDVLVDYMDNHPDVGNVAPKVLNGDMTLQANCRRFPTLWNNFCEASGISKLLRKNRYFTDELMHDFAHDREMDVDVLVGCFWLVRKETFEEVGLLDEDFFIYAEDVDWCKRCWDSGWRVTFFPGAEAIHYRGGSSSNDPGRFSEEQYKAVLQYWQKHHGPAAQLGIRAIKNFRRMLRTVFRFVKPSAKRATG